MRGDDPLRIQQRAGHASFDTTQGYIREAENLSSGFREVFPPLPAELLGTLESFSESYRALAQISKLVGSRANSGGEDGIRTRPAEHERPDPSRILVDTDQDDESERAPKCAIVGEPGRIGTFEAEPKDDARDAPSCSGMALVEERVQHQAVALVRALSALIEGGLLCQARPVAAELARLLDPDADALAVLP